MNNKPLFCRMNLLAAGELRLAQFWEANALKQMCVFWKEAFWWQKKTFSHPLWPVTINKQHLMDFICSLNLVSRTLKRFVIEVTAPHRDITEGFSFLTLQLNFCIIYCKVISTANELSSEWLQCECIGLQWRLNLSVNITHSTVWTRLALVSAENGWRSALCDRLLCVRPATNTAPVTGIRG